MDVITKTPGLQHISEDILKLLKTKGLMNCRLVNTSWKNVMNQSTFWLSKMNVSYIHINIDVRYTIFTKIFNMFLGRFPI